MNITPASNISYKGYDARALKGFLMTTNCAGIANEMQRIGQKEGFKIYSFDSNYVKPICKEGIPTDKFSVFSMWAQDYWTVIKNKLVAIAFDERANSIKDFFGLKYDITQKATRNIPEINNINEQIADILSRTADKETKKNSALSLLSRAFQLEEQRSKINEMQYKTHIEGGNLFIVKGENGKDEVIAGSNRKDIFDTEDIQDIYGVEKVTYLPKMDYHIDLFIRPLNKKRVLVADDTMSLKLLERGFFKFRDYIQTLPFSEQKIYKENLEQMRNFISDFKHSIEENPYSKTDEVARELKKNGYKVIRVPGRVYETKFSPDGSCDLRHLCNYINANVLKNNTGKLVYITNKSHIDNMLGLSSEISKKIGFSFEREFMKSIAKYVSPKHTYFVDGENHYLPDKMLYGYQGGIHCACTEIPKSSTSGR